MKGPTRHVVTPVGFSRIEMTSRFDAEAEGGIEIVA